MIKTHIKNLDRIGGGEYEVIVTSKGGGDASHGGRVSVFIPKSTLVETEESKEGITINFRGDDEIETAVMIARDIIRLFEMILAGEAKEQHEESI